MPASSPRRLAWYVAKYSLAAYGVNVDLFWRCGWRALRVERITPARRRALFEALLRARLARIGAGGVDGKSIIVINALTLRAFKWLMMRK